MWLFSCALCLWRTKQPDQTRINKPPDDKFQHLSAQLGLKSPHFSSPCSTKIYQKFIRREVFTVFIEQIFRRDKEKSCSNMIILQSFLTMDIQIFADENLIGSGPIRLQRRVHKSQLMHLNTIAPFCLQQAWQNKICIFPFTSKKITKLRQSGTE